MGGGELGRHAGSVCASEAGRAPSQCRPRVPRGSSPPRATASHRRGHSAGGRAATFRVLRWPRMHCCGWRAPMHPGLAFASARQPAITRGGIPGSIGFGSIVAGDGRGGATVAPVTSRPAQWRFERCDFGYSSAEGSISPFRSGSGPPWGDPPSRAPRSATRYATTLSRFETRMLHRARACAACRQ